MCDVRCLTRQVQSSTSSKENVEMKQFAISNLNRNILVLKYWRTDWDDQHHLRSSHLRAKGLGAEDEGWEWKRLQLNDWLFQRSSFPHCIELPETFIVTSAARIVLHCLCLTQEAWCSHISGIRLMPDTRCVAHDTQAIYLHQQNQRRMQE